MKKEVLQYAPIARFLKDAFGERDRAALLVEADDPNHKITISEIGFSENEACSKGQKSG